MATLVLRLCRGENNWPMRAVAPPMRLRRIYTTRLVTDTMGAVTSGSKLLLGGFPAQAGAPGKGVQ